MGHIIVNSDALDAYSSWETPKVIVSDGPYGVGGYEGDPKTVDALPSIYSPHLKIWSERSEPTTVLWFWNTELGWATVHPIIKDNGWIYHGCNVWNKGLAHIAGNCNGKTMRQFPVVTEVCVMYVRQPYFKPIKDQMTAQQWLRSEWKRAGFPLSLANKACGVKNAATRKYLTLDHCFYPPPPEVFEKLSSYANTYGEEKGKPYFEIPNGINLDEKGWDRYWYVFNFEYGVSNVWNEPALHSSERMKVGNKVVHLNQKPLKLMKRIIQSTSNVGDVVWEPFGGLCSASLAAIDLGRRPFACEINPIYFNLAKSRIESETLFTL